MFRRIVLIFLLSTISLSSQEKDSLVLKNGIDKPNSTTSHHFGLFHLRINQNFKESPVQKQTTPAEYSNILIDAVFKVFRFDLQTRISDKHELGITLRVFMPTKGYYPFSFFTGDESIEWFHSNVAGGEDAFGRRFFGLNKVTIEYTDRNNQTLSLKNNQFVFAEIEVNHFYYPTIFDPSKKIYVNVGSHLGVNTTKYNSSVDIGLSANISKKWRLKNNNELRFGFGLSRLRKKQLPMEIL